MGAITPITAATATATAPVPSPLSPEGSAILKRNVIGAGGSAGAAAVSLWSGEARSKATDLYLEDVSKWSLPIVGRLTGEAWAIPGALFEGRIVHVHRRRFRAARARPRPWRVSAAS
jgi:hypothetical protein